MAGSLDASASEFEPVLNVHSIPTEAAVAVAPPRRSGKRRPKPGKSSRGAPKPDRRGSEEQRVDALVSTPGRRWSEGLDWPIVLWIAFLHLGALGAPFFFTWKALGLAAVLCWVTGSLGICLGYHRCLTHGSFTTYRPVRWFLAWLGGLAGEGSALTWVSVHRKHHVFSDEVGDPHTPRQGGVWSHMLWFMPHFGRKYYQSLFERYSPDLHRDPMMRMLHSTFLLWHWVVGSALFAVGYYCWDSYTAWSFVFWGVFARLLYVLHVTWFVNSATHIWGYRNYETTDNSRNLWWVGWLAFGEGWHNNHHAFQRMARHGHRWWEFDVTYWAIVALEKVGLAWNVVHDVPGRPGGRGSLSARA
jgi:fatty-acid desaturase